MGSSFLCLSEVFAGPCVHLPIERLPADPVKLPEATVARKR
jgi:hypothetical protein